MQIRFLLGPAGSGKTFQCLAEARSALRRDPDGLPLILLSPKQATFQLERRLLSERDLAGYTRLRIASFERLAIFVFEQLGCPAPELLAEEGRIMVLRALLEEKRADLEVFRASARLPGFARQLSGLLRELQQHQVSPARLESLALRAGAANRLDARLRDLARIFAAYNDWLSARKLEDADRLLDLAIAAIKQSGSRENARNLKVHALWLDGFAQMTPQERHLLAALAPFCDSMTLAFCLDHEPGADLPWHSAWAPVAGTFIRCRMQLDTVPGADLQVEVLKRDREPNRFSDSQTLRSLEMNWGATGPAPHTPNPDALRVVECASPENEVEWAAREIRRRVRETGCRFREVAVLLRSLDGYHDAVRRIFARYEIPVFIDRRESVSHHPLAELTRYALRVAAFGWEHEDWFGALKTGLVPANDWETDRLENEALLRGWRGRARWASPIEGSDSMERLRQQIVPPFARFADALAVGGGRPDGAQLARALRDLWKSLKVNRTLERWSSAAASLDGLPNPAIHETVWQQMLDWLRNIELAFENAPIALDRWMPIVEAGLANLSAGVVPPALDQVLIGAIDRSRNPELKLAIVLGMNEGVFPAPPPPPLMLTRQDRESLAAFEERLGLDHWQHAGLERYYGYIAMTRSRERLALTHARQDGEGCEMNRSCFLDDLQRLFPTLKVEQFDGTVPVSDAEHWTDLAGTLLKSGRAERETWYSMSALGAASWAEGFEEVLDAWRSVANPASEPPITTELAESIYGIELQTSVSAIEDFAACPFRFFAARGLRARERPEFEADVREKGNFQHEILKEFHLELVRAGKRWRDARPDEARLLVRSVGERVLPLFRDGLFLASPARLLSAQILIENLEKLIGTLCAWASHCEFDPVAVETSFGLPDSVLPAWRIDLDGRHVLALRGRVDRVDLCRLNNGEVLALVVDYKSTARELDPLLLENGIELQLIAYLGVLSEIDQLDSVLGVGKVRPAGAFYVGIRTGGGSAHTRNEEREGRATPGRNSCQHRGRFDGTYLARFDNRGLKRGEQFKFALTKGAAFAKRGNEALDGPAFEALVAQARGLLVQHGIGIYSGKVNADPYRAKQKTACDHCAYRAVCRFDPWTQPFRALRHGTEGSA